MTDRPEPSQEAAQQAPKTTDPETEDKANMLTLEICFLAFVGVVVVLAFFEALTYQLVSARTPFVIMAPLFVLIVVQGVRLYRQRDEADLGHRLGMAVSGRMPGLNRAVALLLWLAALLLLIVGLGHYIGLAVFSFMLMWSLGRVPLLGALAITAGMLLVIFLVFEVAFDLELYRGLLFRWMAGYRDF